MNPDAGSGNQAQPPERKTPAILVVDDEPDAGMIFAKIAEQHGCSVRHCFSVEEALPIIHSPDSPDIVFLDINLPGMNGIAALPHFLKANPFLRVVMITGYQTIESVVAAMKSGAVDYLVKPLTPQIIQQSIQKYGSHKSTVLPTREFPARPLEAQLAMKRQGGAGESFVASSPAMQGILTMAEKFAASDGTVLILGESGTGKEMLAHHIHQKSARKDGPFITIDCASIPETLFESELFGYEKGAFTGADAAKAGRFEMADGGTLFLDEIGNVPLAVQAKLLRFMEDQTISRLGGKKSMKLDVRFVTATNSDLRKMVEKGSFREDFYYRLSALTIHLFPLRNRPKEEREALVRHFLAEHARVLHKPLLTLSEPAAKALHNYPWPGNVRELKNALYSACLLSDSTLLEVENLPVGIQSYFGHSERPAAVVVDEKKDQALRDILDKVEREHILSVMEENNWNKKRASEILKMDYKTLLSKLKKYSLEKD